MVSYLKAVYRALSAGQRVRLFEQNQIGTGLFGLAVITASSIKDYNSIAGEKTHGLNRADDSLKIFA